MILRSGDFNRPEKARKKEEGRRKKKLSHTATEEVSLQSQKRTPQIGQKPARYI